MSSGLLDPEFLIGASLSDGRFKVVARIGAGSMAVVYRAFDHRLETDVVVKVPKKQKLQDPGLRERFRRESRLLVQLQHPHIVRIFDIGMHANIPYVVMQYLSGGCLLDRLMSRNGRLSAVKVSSLRDWLAPVSKALDYAHSQQIVHRDVKPANILFDHAGNAYLGDFGLTKIIHGDPTTEDADETGAGLVVGTPNYVAPEIVLGREYGGAADQYSLAISVYHALVGQPPMQGKSPSATMVNQTRRVLPLLSDVRKSVPREAAEAIARALSKVPDQRFPTCGDFAEAVLAGLASTMTNAQKGATVSSGETQTSDSTTQPHAKSSSAVNGSENERRKRFAHATEKQTGNSVQQSAAKRSGVLSCPVCDRQLRLRPEHAGKIGRCIQCQTRLFIADDICSVRCLDDVSSSSIASTGASSSDDLVLGDSVFGVRLSKRSLVLIGVLMLMATVLGTALFIHQLTKVDLEKEQQRIRQDYMNREE